MGEVILDYYPKSLLSVMARTTIYFSHFFYLLYIVYVYQISQGYKIVYI